MVIKIVMKNFLKKIYVRIRALANLQDDTNIEATISSIQKSIEFKGPNVWILAFAIIIASVGLNVNSTAVIIGAMLISPLMGPINGIGLAIGCVDMDLLKHSLRHLLIMVLISLVASTTYFLLSPLSDAQSELLARTTPTIYDVLIAFFGGMAGIVALSRREQSITIISGVAIATALMPPLCTAGYGLATWQLSYFSGAFYLFFINSFFIALATFVMVRYLHFPQKTYLDESRRKLVKRGISLFALIVIIPSVFIAYRVVRETAFNSAVIRFVGDIQKNELFSEAELFSSRREYSRKEPQISISFIGKQLTEQQIEYLHKQLDVYGLEEAHLEIKQMGGGTLDMGAQTELITDILNKKDMQIQHQDSLIGQMALELEKLHGSAVAYRKVAREIAVQYPVIESFAITNVVYTHTQDLNQDTVPAMFVKWSAEPDTLTIQKMTEWLRVRLEQPALVIYPVP